MLAEAGMRLAPAPKGGYRFEVDGEPVKATDVLNRGVKTLEKRMRAPWEPAGDDVPIPAPPPAEPEPASGMDEDLEPRWRWYLVEEVAWQAESRRQAKQAMEEWKARTKAVFEANRAVRRQVRAETRLAAKLVHKAKRQSGRLPAGTAEALRLAIEERGRSRLVPVPAQGRSGRPAWPAFADWLELQGEPALAERWRRRGTLSPQQASAPKEPEEDAAYPRPGL